jgi:hypothetical protein
MRRLRGVFELDGKAAESRAPGADAWRRRAPGPPRLNHLTSTLARILLLQVGAFGDGGGPPDARIAELGRRTRHAHTPRAGAEPLYWTTRSPPCDAKDSTSIKLHASHTFLFSAPASGLWCTH